MDKFACVFLGTCLLAGIANAATEPKPVNWLEYSRSGPGPEAAVYAKAAAPELGAAHSLSLSSSLTDVLTDEQRLQLSIYGPWLTEDGLSNNAQQLIRHIQEAGIHGLNPDAYHLKNILRTVDALSLLDKPDTHADWSVNTIHYPNTSHLRRVFTPLMNRAFSKLLSNLGRGVVDARRVQNKLYRDVPVVQPAEVLALVSNGLTSVDDAIKAATPSQAYYQQLTQRMRDLLTERASRVRRTQVHNTGDLSETHLLADITRVKYRLHETGDLPADFNATSLYDEQLESALTHFQQRHGLEANGALTRATRDALNLSVENEIKAVALSLERWRWMPRALGEKHVFINIPDYRLEVKNGDATSLSMVTVVGATAHQTPTFSRDMSYLEFNPTWTVPTKIANAELIPRERRRPGYLASRQFVYLERVDNRLVQIPSSQVTSEDFQKEHFPYMLQQKGGPINALGRIKFMLPNPYAIYLHDTQAKKHFTLNDRAYSHGCIRLSEPDRLATFLMREDGYTASEISTALSSNDTLRKRLRTTVPTHITYLTTWVDSDNNLQRRKDVYGHDKALLKALTETDTLVSTLDSSIDMPYPPQLLASGE